MLTFFLVFFLFVQKTIKYSSVYGIPLRSICDEVSHGRSKLIFKRLGPLLRGCSHSSSFFFIVKKTIKIFECLRCSAALDMRWSIPWKIKADVRGIGTASARMLRETTHSQGNARVLPHFFFLIVQKTIKIFIFYF